MNDMKEALRECYELDRLTNRFSIMAINHCRIQVDKKRQVPFEARDEAVSDFAYKLVKSWRNIKPDKSPFSYLSLMASSCLLDVQKRYEVRRKKAERVKNEKTEIFYEVFNDVTASIKVSNLSAGEKAIIRRQIISMLRKGVSKYELSRVTGIPRRTIIRWHQNYVKYGSKFYTMDRRINNRRPFK
jgi:uncharacterized protein YerC